MTYDELMLIGFIGCAANLVSVIVFIQQAKTTWINHHAPLAQLARASVL